MKKFTFLLVLVLVCILLSGQIVNANIKLRVGTFAEKPRRSSTEHGIAEFKKAHPDVEVVVEHTTWGDYWQKLYADIAVGEAPDVCRISTTNWAKLVDEDVLLNLKPYFNRLDTPGTEIDKYFSSLIDLLTVEDKLLATPAGVDSLAYIVNKKIFEKKGIDIPEGDWTWKEFKQVVKKLSEERIFGTEVGLFPHWYGAYYFSNGGELVSEDKTKATGYLDSQENVETVKFWTDIIKEGFAPKPGGLDQFGGQTGAMLAGVLALTPTDGFHQMSNVIEAGMQDQFTSVKPPHPEGKELVPTIACHAFTVPKSTKHPRLATELAGYLSWGASVEDENPVKLAPTLEGARRQIEGKFSYYEPLLKLAQNPRVRPQEGSYNPYAEILIEEITNMVEEIVLNDVPVKDAISKAASNYDRRVAQEE